MGESRLCKDISFLYNHNVSNTIGDKLKQLLFKAKREIVIVAPYISKNSLIDIIKNLDKVKIRILTRFSLEDFISGASDINVLSSIIKKNNIEIRYYSNLHAKVYIVDEEKAIITSANFTQNGMYNNLEYGVLIESNLNEMLNDINNLWENACIVNVDIMNLIYDNINVLSKNMKETYKFKNEINKINKKIIEEKRSHIYMSCNKNINKIPEYEALDLVINRCEMENIKEKIIKAYDIIKNNIPRDIRKSCSFRYIENKARADVAANIMNYRIFLLPYKNKPIVQIIYPKEDLNNLNSILLNQRLSSIKRWEFKSFECEILYFTLDEILKLEEIHWKSFKKGCIYAYNARKSRNRDSNMVVKF